MKKRLLALVCAMTLVLGSTGYSMGPHLHLELFINGVNVNPLLYVQ